MTLRCGFIGLGDIGRPMAAHYPRAGFETTVCDIKDEPVRELVAAGARAAATPRELAAACDLISVCVPADEQVRAVMNGHDGVLRTAARGVVVAIHSTIHPDTAREIKALAAPRGVGVLDACVTGGAERARAAALTYLVGGDLTHLEIAKPVLESNAETIIHAGEIGAGAKLKLCINLMTYIQWAAAYESFALARAAGLPVERFEEAGRANGQLSELMARYLQGHKLPEQAVAEAGYQELMRGHMRIAEKDLSLALQVARESGVALPVGSLVSQLMARLYNVRDARRR